MPVVIYDPLYEQHVRAVRSAQSPGARDEVWDGVLVMPPLPNIEHQILATDLALVFAAVIDRPAGDLALVGANVSDRAVGWEKNYREPDVLVVLHTNPAQHCGTHWAGGPDLAVEIVSPGEDPRLKLAFYEKVNTREMLIVERDPWAVEQYQLQGGKLVLVGTATAANGAVLQIVALPLKLELRPGAARPVIHITHTVTGQIWTA
ncbi:MAG TPA: Uma2 family endonuclease [Gemmata sp.]